MPRNYTWNPAKNKGNIRDHGVDFAQSERFEWETAVIDIDDREDYGELREVATGFLGDILHVLVYTVRGDATHIIRLRRASKRERKNFSE